MIVSRTAIRAAYERALILGLSPDEAVARVARDLGQDEGTVRAVLDLKEPA